MNKHKIVSVDAETNGLWGQPFAVGFAIFDQEGSLLDQKIFKCPIEGALNQFVEANVLPQLRYVEDTHSTYLEMLYDIGHFWKTLNPCATTLWHMGHVVEAHLFRELHKIGAIGDWDAPYTPIELSVLLRENGHEPDSVDRYLSTHGINLPSYKGGTHNPLYDAIAAGRAYFHLKGLKG